MMPGLDTRLVVHSLNVDPRIKLVIQPARVFNIEVEAQITQEVVGSKIHQAYQTP